MVVIAPSTLERVTDWAIVGYITAPSGYQTTIQTGGPATGAATIGLPRFGTCTVRVVLQDAAVNRNGNQAAGWSIPRPAPAAPATPAFPFTPATPIATRGPAPVPVAVETSVRPPVARDRPGTRTVTGTVTIRNRRYRVHPRLRSSAWKAAKVAVRFAGSTRCKGATVTRTVRQRSH
jgi:hypothetical protein